MAGAYVIRTWGLGGSSRYAEVWSEPLHGAPTLLYRTRVYSTPAGGLSNAHAAQDDARAWITALTAPAQPNTDGMGL